jgi:hypothetical protein
MTLNDRAGECALEYQSLRKIPGPSAAAGSLLPLSVRQPFWLPSGSLRPCVRDTAHDCDR